MNKLLSLAILIIVITSCAQKKEVLLISENTYINGCPDNGTCGFEIMNNTSVSLVRDEFGNFYPRFSNDIKTNTLKVTYDKNVPEGIMDANYQEVFFITVDKSKKELVLNDKAMYRANIIYHRACRCKGETGYEYLLDGDFYYRRMRTVVDLQLTTNQSEFPMLMNNFSVKADVFENF